MQTFVCFLLLALVGRAVVLAVPLQREPFHSSRSPTDTIENYEIIQPVIIYQDSNEPYPKKLELQIATVNTTFTLKLKMNEDLLPTGFTSVYYDEAGKEIIMPSEKTENCYYQGNVEGHPQWIASMSTCQGLEGSFGDLEDAEHYYAIEPLDYNNTALTQPHAFYFVSEYSPMTGTCGNPEDHFHSPTDGNKFTMENLRQRRQIDVPLYIELVLVNDFSLYQLHNQSLAATMKAALDMANIADNLYRPLNIRIAVVHMITWTDGDRIAFHPFDDGFTVLKFAEYQETELRNQLHLSFDSAMLLTGGDVFVLGVVPQIGKICSEDRSASLVVAVFGLDDVAHIAAHELGHLLTMRHDNPDPAICTCPDGISRCIMNAFGSIGRPATKWSSCSKDFLQTALNTNQGFCLTNKPTTTVNISVDYDSPPGFTPGLNEYRAASGPVTVTCTAIAPGTGAVSYQWSSTCRDCPFQSATINLVELARVHSGDNGTHTCVATRDGNNATASIDFLIVGAGIQLFDGSQSGNLQNNGIAVLHNPGGGFRLRIFCGSDSMQENVGQFIGLDGIAITGNSFFSIAHPRPGEVSVDNLVGSQSALTVSEQGVYTCRIPLQSGRVTDINVGVYPTGFNTLPRIVALTSESSSNSTTLTCTSTGSPATIVTWTRDTQPLVIDGNTYRMVQSVTNRAASTYENVLTINQPHPSTVGSIFTCTVINALGSDTAEIEHLSINITVDYTHRSDFNLGLNEYRAASGPVIVTCAATGPLTGAIDYQWSSTCRNCPFQSATSSLITRGAVHSGDNGTHTCTVSRRGSTASASIDFLVVGAGIQLFRGSPRGSLPNNALAISDNPGSGYRLRIFCRSDSMSANVGQFIGPNGINVTSNGYFAIAHPQPGEITVENIVGSQNILTAGQQGVYTCRIPLQNGGTRDINVGIYPSGFNTAPRIVALTSASSNLFYTLTCTSTGSPATTVIWTRNGQPIVMDGSTYSMVQTVTNRTASTYENVLTIKQPLDNTAGDTFTCSVTNALGSDSLSIEHLSINITVDYSHRLDFNLGLNEYRAASGPVIVTCAATGPLTGVIDYQWSSTCRNCSFQSATSSLITRSAVHSGDNGTHTCTVSRGGSTASASIDFLVVDAGIQLFRGSPRGSLPNNALAISDNPGSGYRLRIFCRSDSMSTNVGQFIGLNGINVTSNGYFAISHPQPGEMTVENIVGFHNTLTSSQQGVYTCRIPLQNGDSTDVNVGIYPSRFNTAPRNVALTSASSNLFYTLTCTSTGSPATTVIWTRNKQPLLMDGSTYRMVQTVTNRTASTYENVLTINQPLGNTAGDTFTCRVTNALGTDSLSIEHLSINITVNYSHRSDFNLGLNEYRAASGPVIVTCAATGPLTGAIDYQWSSTCRNCPFQSTTSSSITRSAVHSGDNGTHTCTVSRGGSTASASIDFLVVDAGIQLFRGSPRGSLPNNAVAISDNPGSGYRLRIFCRSDSMSANVGQFIGLNGINVTSNGYFAIAHPQPGEITIENTVGSQNSLTASQQGVYTCHIPLQNGDTRDINVGIYPSGFNTAPRIVALTSASSTLFYTLTCISTGSPATTVIWTRNGQPLVMDGSTYHMVQTVTNRAASTYENILTISQPLGIIAGNTFTCSVTNVLGSDTATITIN